MDLIAHQQAPPCHFPGDLGGLAPGGGTQVQNLLPGLGVKEYSGGHGAGLLEVVDTGVVVWMQAGSGVRIIVVPRFLPGHRGGHKRQLRRFPLLRVKPQGHRPGSFQAGKEFREFPPQLSFHPLQKQFRQHIVSPVRVSF